MNILFITHESGKEFNGSSKSLIDIIKSFDVNENKLFVIVRHDYGILYQKLQSENITIWKMKYSNWIDYKPEIKIDWLKKKLKWILFYNLKNKSVVSKLKKRVIKYNIGIIHSNSVVVNLGAILHIKYNYNHIWHLREFGEEDFDFYPLTSKKKYIYFLNKIFILFHHK
jgi:hypothetical protein